jgi:PST family polysaccharide transporter
MTVVNKLKDFFSGRFIRNVGWLGIAELVNRVFRLGTTVTLARMFSAEEYGLMAVVYTTFEIAQIFVFNSGFNAKIIQADEENLPAICNTSYWLNLILCGAIFLLQIGAAFPLANFYGKEELVLPLCVSALVYLHFPFVVINYALISRENKLKIIAVCQVSQSLISNIVTIILALSGLGIWAIVWAMLLSNPVWIVVTWIYNSWRPPSRFQLQEWQEIIKYGSSILGVELLTKLRGNLDYLLVGKFLGVDALGLYYFAFNAGFGISWNVIKAFSNALFPYICQVKDNLKELEERYLTSLKKLLLVVIPFAVLQSSLSPLYVPIVFGEKWVKAIPILIIICLSAIPFSLSFFTDNLLNAVGKPQISLIGNTIYTFVFALLLLVAVKGGILSVAIAVLVSHIIMSSLFTFWSLRYIFVKKLSFS